MGQYEGTLESVQLDSRLRAGIVRHSLSFIVLTHLRAERVPVIAYLPHCLHVLTALPGFL